ncbi:MAG: ATP-dependent DNA helicase, partial [Flavobacteriales bacterium]
GKLVDAEPSRFIEEIDAAYVDRAPTKDDYVFKPFVDQGIFDAPQQSAKRNPSNGRVQKERINTAPTAAQRKSLKKLQANRYESPAAPMPDVRVDMLVEHNRFGRGKVVALEGNGSDQKATITFQGTGEKKLLLRFAKLKILSS